MTLAVPEVVLAARRRVEVFLGGGPGSAIRSFWEWLANLGQQGKQVKPGYEHHCVCLAWIRLSGESCCSCPRSCQNLLDPGSERPLSGVSIARRFACFCLATCAGVILHSCPGGDLAGGFLSYQTGPRHALRAHERGLLLLKRFCICQKGEACAQDSDFSTYSKGQLTPSDLHQARSPSGAYRMSTSPECCCRVGEPAYQSVSSPVSRISILEAALRRHLGASFLVRRPVVWLLAAPERKDASVLPCLEARRPVVRLLAASERKDPSRNYRFTATSACACTTSSSGWQ